MGHKPFRPNGLKPKKPKKTGIFKSSVYVYHKQYYADGGGYSKFSFGYPYDTEGGNFIMYGFKYRARVYAYNITDKRQRYMWRDRQARDGAAHKLTDPYGRWRGLHGPVGRFG
jgi:hypothetical protein